MANSTLKNRIVGTLIVVAIAVIFLPDFFSQGTENSSQEFRSTPERPGVERSMSSPNFPEEFNVEGNSDRETVAVPIQQDQIEIRELPASVDLDGSPTDESSNQDLEEEGNTNELSDTSAEHIEARSGENSEQENSPRTDSLMETEAAWVIQLGAFQNQETVENLLSELQDAGYNAYSRVYQRDSGQLHLVLVGPDMNKSLLEEQLEPLYELTTLEGKVLPYRPGSN